MIQEGKTAQGVSTVGTPADESHAIEEVPAPGRIRESTAVIRASIEELWRSLGIQAIPGSDAPHLPSQLEKFFGDEPFTDLPGIEEDVKKKVRSLLGQSAPESPAEVLHAFAFATIKAATDALILEGVRRDASRALGGLRAQLIRLERSMKGAARTMTKPGKSLGTIQGIVTKPELALKKD
jgi:hypothetical protein